MKGGSAMLIATIMSAFSSTPVVEAKMLVTNTTVNSSSLLSSSEVLAQLESRKQEASDILADFRVYYYNLCNGIDAVDLEQFENLKSLELYTRGMNEFMKAVLIEHSDAIKHTHGEKVYDAFRHIVATQGQIRKNISNILALYYEQQGLVETIIGTAFEPTKEFITAAYQVSENLYSTH